MATTDVCSNFNAKHNEEVNFTNSTGQACVLTQASAEWAFTSPSPFTVAVGGSKTKIKSKNELPDGTYTYVASTCSNEMPKSVTVP